MDTASTPRESLRHAVEKAGGQKAFAALIGCSQSNVSLMLKSEAGLSPRFVLAAEKSTGISRHALRPDIYPLTGEAESSTDRHNGVRA